MSTVLKETTKVAGIESGEEEWKLRMREMQGAIAVASLFEIVVGFSGLMGYLIKFIGPLTIVPTITLIALPLFEVTYEFAETQWWLSILMVVLITLFSQVVHNVNVPFPTLQSGKLQKGSLQIFKLFPVILAMIIVWIVCAILTAAGVFTDDQKNPQYRARTDARFDVLQKVPWFRVPYPGQWGTPTVSSAAVLSMLAGYLSSMIESIGDYHACAQLAGAKSPPKHAINRGLGTEGIGNCIAGVLGTGNGTTSFSQNVGAIGITKVGSRRVVQASGLIMIILAVIGKFGGVFATIPDPVLGGTFIVSFGIIVGVGLSMLQYVQLSSMRNIFVLGVSLFFGMVLPFYVKRKPQSIDTGVGELDQILRTLLSTNMAIGGALGFLLDNTLPGTLEERGLKKWRKQYTDTSNDSTSNISASIHSYDIPFITGFLQKFRFTKYVPFLPYYGPDVLDTEVGDKEQNHDTSL